MGGKKYQHVNIVQREFLMTNSIVFHDLFITISNEETFADASELLENIKQMFLRYYKDGDVISRFKSSIIHWCVTVAKGLKNNLLCTTQHAYLKYCILY